ncbi:MAG: hypothetical protein ACRDTU_00805 [Micromonosporaceae bacterium]
MSDRRRLKQPPLILAAAVTAFLAAGLAGCSSDEDQYVYCIDDDGEVVDPDYCEDEEYGDEYGSSSYWYYVASSRYSVGSRVPSDHVSSRVSPSDSSGRASAGIPSSGKVGGTTIRGGGFGSGSGSGYSGSRGGGYSGGS